ncbi:transcriptional regulator family: bZIP [Trichoderma aggressivum f. europaeum]|uniref:Putative transcription factor kapC n=1 Tax=Trichoderma aggressivum f. europaeum TaxID=173218 RepID=A0AAE1M7Y8_9HYPO|nr:transcriptional regulator family: bZIP [Trichoderma aggressivum f. europaeum]
MIAELTQAGSPEQHLRAQLELLQNHDSAASSASPNPSARDPRAPSRPPNGYDVLAPQDVSRPLAKLDAEAHIHPDLRASVGHAPAANMMPMVPPAGHSPGPAGPGPSAVPLAPAPPQQMSMDDSNPADGRKAKRELSQSKRAAQNRAAQRAFRQRKEGYIKKLEQQVRDLADLEHSYKSMQSENYALREYVIHLQSRLLDTQGEFPPPPPNVNLSQPSSAAPPPPSVAEHHQQQHQQQHQQHHQPPPPPQATNSTNSGVGTPLEAVAQAVAGLAAQEQMVERSQTYPSPPFKTDPAGEQDNTPRPTADDLNRSLNPEERPSQP